MAVNILNASNGNYELSFVDITPEMAEELLQNCNTKNRSLRKAKVRLYATDMKNGDWRETPEPIIFSSNGTLLDGQHRLYAVMDSGVTVRFLIAKGGDAAIQNVIDGGLPRSVADRLKLNGIVSRNFYQVGAIGSSMVSRCRRINLTHQQQMRIVERHMEAIYFSIDCVPSGYLTKGIACAPVRAVIGRAFYTGRRDEIEAFCDVLCGGIATRKLDRVPYKLSHVLRKLDGGGQIPRAEKYDKTSSALAAYLRGDAVKFIRASKIEKFPLPEEESRPRI